MLRLFDWIEEMNTKVPCLFSSLRNMALHSYSHLLERHNLMVYRKGGIVPYWIWYGIWWVTPIFPFHSGVSHSRLPRISLFVFYPNPFLLHHMGYGMVKNQVLSMLRFGDVRLLSKDWNRTSWMWNLLKEGLLDDECEKHMF